MNGIIDADAQFQDFTVQNKNWLPSYAIFCHLREKYKAANGNPLHWKVRISRTHAGLCVFFARSS